MSKGSRFNFVIQNPPYSRSLHLNFLEKGYDMLADDGQMVIIEPSSWLIELRQNIAEKKSSQMKKYIDIKKKINGHISKVIIENYNKEFNVGLYVPFSITYINKAKKYNNIEFFNCGIKFSAKHNMNLKDKKIIEILNHNIVCTDTFKWDYENWGPIKEYKNEALF